MSTSHACRGVGILVALVWVCCAQSSTDVQAFQVEPASGLTPERHAATIDSISRTGNGLVEQEYRSTFDGFQDGIEDDEWKLISDNVDSPLRECNPPEHFSCRPCNCSKSNENLLSDDRYGANCANFKLFEIPSTLPYHTSILNMSSNYLKYFHLRHASIYPNLSIIDLSRNQIRKIINESFTPFTTDLIWLSLHCNKLADLKNISFQFFPNLRTIILSKNDISTIPSQAFDGCLSLSHLDLSFNKIQHIAISAFDSLNNLKELFLNNNIYLGFHREFFVPRLFKGLVKLQSLHIQCAYYGSQTYPNQILGSLIELRELFIDCIKGDVELGVELKNLTHLSTLSFSHGCKCHLRNITSSFFNNTPTVKSLIFHEPQFDHVDSNAFRSIPHLERYVIMKSAFTDYKLQKAFEDLAGLRHTSLKSLTVNGFSLSSSPCQELTGREGQLIRKLTHLEELDLSHNRLALLRLTFLQELPKTLKRLLLHNNKLSMEYISWHRSRILPSLVEIDLRNQNMNTGPFGSSVDGYHQSLLSSNATATDEMLKHNPIAVSLEGASYSGNYLDVTEIHEKPDWNIGSRRGKCMYEISSTHATEEVSSGGQYSLVSHSRPNVRFLSNLKILKSSRFFFYGDFVLFGTMHSNFLSHIFLSWSFLTNWGNGRLPRTVQTADLSFNFCGVLSHNFFPTNSKLRYLFVQKNSLGDVLDQDSKGDIFANLNRLEYLDVSSNYIFHMPQRILRGLRHLQILLVRGNKLQVLKMDFSYTPDLCFLDLSKNSITWINENTRTSLDVIASRHNLKMDLTDNPLPCTCEGIEILKWMASTKVKMHNAHMLKCGYTHRNAELMGDIQKRIDVLQRRCTSIQDSIVGGSLVAAFLLLLLGCALLYRHRWKLIYAKNICLIKLYGFRPKGRTKSAFKNDAYVVYSEEDRDFVLYSLLNELEEKRGHKLCVDDRDFMPGTYNFNNMACAVENSNVTIIVLTPDFLQDRELDYAFQMALIKEYSGQFTYISIVALLKRDKRMHLATPPRNMRRFREEQQDYYQQLNSCHNHGDVLLLLNFRRPSDKDLSRDLLVLMKKGRFLDYPRQEEGEAIPESTMKAFWDTLSREIGHTQNSSPE